jgi:hypothetical protein
MALIILCIIGGWVAYRWGYDDGRRAASRDRW